MYLTYVEILIEKSHDTVNSCQMLSGMLAVDINRQYIQHTAMYTKACVLYTKNTVPCPLLLILANTH